MIHRTIGNSEFQKKKIEITSEIHRNLFSYVDGIALHVFHNIVDGVFYWEYYSNVIHNHVVILHVGILHLFSSLIFPPTFFPAQKTRCNPQFLVFWDDTCTELTKQEGKALAPHCRCQPLIDNPQWISRGIPTSRMGTTNFCVIRVDALLLSYNCNLSLYLYSLPM